MRVWIHAVVNRKAACKVAWAHLSPHYSYQVATRLDLLSPCALVSAAGNTGEGNTELREPTAQNSEGRVGGSFQIFFHSGGDRVLYGSSKVCQIMQAIRKMAMQICIQP